jgi:hypothetical protein
VIAANAKTTDILNAFHLRTYLPAVDIVLPDALGPTPFGMQINRYSLFWNQGYTDCIASPEPINQGK